MSKKCLSVVVTSDKVTILEAIAHTNQTLEIQYDSTWKLADDDRAAGYSTIHQQFSDYIREHGIELVVFKASALSQGATKLAMLTAAELRGVLMSAAGGLTETVSIAKALISRNFGNRKVDEYVKDDSFWDKHVIDGELRKGSREAAMVLIAATANK